MLQYVAKISGGQCFSLFLNLQGAPSKWAAQRIREAKGSQFDAVTAAKEGRPVYFTGEVCIMLSLCLPISCYRLPFCYDTILRCGRAWRQLLIALASKI